MHSFPQNMPLEHPVPVALTASHFDILPHPLMTPPKVYAKASQSPFGYMEETRHNASVLRDFISIDLNSSDGGEKTPENVL